MTRTKGQMFIIGAIVVAIALIALKEYFGAYSLVEEHRFQQAQSVNAVTQNVRNEYRSLVNAALITEEINTSARDMLYNFSQFIRSSEQAEIIYLFAYANSSRDELYILLGNFLGDTIDVTINTTGTLISSYEFPFMEDGEARMALFTLPHSFDGIVEITLTYDRGDEHVVENVLFDVSKNNALLFVDVTVSSTSASSRVKDVYAPAIRHLLELPGLQQNPGPFCGDTVCDANAGETCALCASDCCPAECGNNICEGGYGETCSSCQDDCCPINCGDGICAAIYGESCYNCEIDCGDCGSG